MTNNPPKDENSKPHIEDTNSLKMENSLLSGAYFQLQDATKKLKDSEEKYRSLTENSPDLIARFDKQLRHLYVNQAAAKSGKYSAQEYIGKTMKEVGVAEQEVKRWEERVRTVFETGQVMDIEDTFTTPEGEKYFSTKFVPEKASDGTIHSVLSVARDITERKKEEEELKKVTGDLKLILESTDEGIYGVDKDGNCTFINKAAIKMLGFTHGEVLGKNSHKLWHYKHADGSAYSCEQCSIHKALETGEGSRVDNEVFWSKAGKPFSVEYSTFPISENGIIKGGVVTFSDITERKKAEESLIEKEKEAEEAQRIGRIGNWTWDIATDTIFWSKEYHKIIGLDLSEPPPNYVDHLKAYTPESQAKLDAAVKKEMQTGEPYELDLEFTQPKSGAARWITARSETIRDAQGKIIGLRGTAQDITERKESEQHICELNEVRNKFIDIISHQLRTPLGVVNWNLETLLNGEFGKLEATQEKFIKATYDASTKTTARIHDLLTAMDVEEGRVRFEKEDVEIDSICANIVSEEMNACSLKNIICTYTSPESDLPSINGDAEKIRTVITKLIENAVSYTKEGGKIFIKLSKSDSIIRFEVQDNGIGIPEPEQHRIFSRFFRGSNSSVMKTDAFGLGLYLAKHFIEQHKGKIGFQSKEGVGSTFWFEIPLK